jgi:glutathione S-transferase
VAFEFVRIPGILSSDPSAFADNPLMRVPTLVHGDEMVIESDHIARYIVARYDPDDRFGVRSEHVRDLNRLAVIGGIMDNEVVLILAKRGGLVDLDGVAYFRKLASAIDAGLAWLDRETDPDAMPFDYVDIATICMWQHLIHYQMVKGTECYSRIAARVGRHADRASIASSTPEASLADALAAGWKPG